MRKTVPLNRWSFSIDSLQYQKEVTVPHTWNVDDAVMDCRGIAGYRTALTL